MSSKWILILGLLLGVLASALLLSLLQQGTRSPLPDAESGDSARFVLFRGTERWIDETFSLSVAANGDRLLVSQSTLTVAGARIELAQEARYDGSFRPLAYELTAETPTGRQTIRAQRDEGKFVMEVRAGGGRQSDASEASDDLFLLDNNVMAHYALLYEAIRAGRVGASFTAAIPQALARIPARWDAPESAHFRSKDRTYEAETTTVHVGDTAIDLVSYGGRLVGLVNRAQGTVAYEANLLPDGLEMVEEAPAALPSGLVEREVAFDSAGLRLAGTLTSPAAGIEARCAVVFVAGSGPVDRDGNAPGLAMDAYRQIARSLVGAGIASLRYDKRGVGQSEGDARLASRADLLADLQAAWGFLGRAPETAGLLRLALGHSEGVYLVTELAAGNPDVAGLVLLCGSARPLGEITRWQVETLLRQQGATDDQLEAALEQEDQFIAFVKSSQGHWADYSADALREAMPWLTETAAAQLKGSALSLPWIREHYNADPAAALARVACPVLIVSGGKDAQVPVGDGEAMAAILRDAGNRRVEALLLEDLNHVLRRHPEAPNLAYQHLDEPVDPRIAAAITAWVGREIGG